MNLQTIQQQLTFSKVLKALSLMSAIATMVKGLHEPSLWAAFLDSNLYEGLIVTLGLFFAKSNGEHGTPASPLDAAQVAKVVAVESEADPAPNSK